MRGIKTGFSLIELLLVIGVIMAMSIIKMRDINEEIQTTQTKMLAEQIKTVASATNAFLVLKYSDISTLKLPDCNSANKTCNITLADLNNEALLPPNFNDKTIYGNPYEIQLKLTGASPNYMLSGLVLTKGIKNTENTPSLVFLGKTLREIGRDGGINKNKGNIIGTSNGWSADSALFPILADKINYIGSAVGALSGAYYVYLRRDGTLPMTGDLNLDGHNINNVAALNATGNITTTSDLQARNIKATGKVDADGDISSGRYLIAKSKNEDASIKIGGDGTGNHNFMFESQKRTSVVFFPSVNSTLLTYKFRGNINILSPSGDSVGVKLNGTTGNITASGNIESSQNVKGATLEATGRATVGEFIQLNGQATVGATCSSNGLQGRTPEGAILSCVNGVWKSAGGINDTFLVYGASVCSSGKTSTATCTSGSKFISGGYNLTSWYGRNGRNAPDSAYPTTTGFVVNTPGSFEGCVRAVALCSKL